MASVSPDAIVAAFTSRFGWARLNHTASGLYLESVCWQCGKRKLSVNLRTGYAKCWKCGQMGRTEDLLGKRMEVNLSAILSPPPRPQGIVYPGTIVQLGAKGSEAGVRYCESRGFNVKELVSSFDTCFCTSGRTFGNFCLDSTGTLLFPVTMEGKDEGWQIRLLYDPDGLTPEECVEVGMPMDDDGKLTRWPKYFTMPGMRKSEVLYNYDNAVKSDVVVVTEGVFDTFAVGRCAVATFGKSLSPVQLNMLCGRWKVVVNLLDPDAQKETGHMENTFRVKGQPFVTVNLPEGQDAGSTSRGELWSRIAKALKDDGHNIKKLKVLI